MIVCSGPNCQTTVGCQCHGAFGRYQITSDAPVVVRKIETAYDRAFAAGRLAGLREAAEVARSPDHTLDWRARERIAASILALAEGKEG